MVIGLERLGELLSVLAQQVLSQAKGNISSTECFQYIFVG